MQNARPKIMIATLGTRGDVQPYVALAGALTRLGADVVVSTGEGFDDMIGNAGARARPAPVNFQTLLQQADVKAALHSAKGMIKAARQNIVLQQDIAVALWQTGLEEKPDLILFNLKATVMTLVGRRLGVPALPVSLQPVTAPTGSFPLPLFGWPDLGAFLNRKSYGFARLLMTAGLRPLYKPLKTEAAPELSMTGSTIDGFMPDGSNALSLQAFSTALAPTPGDWSGQFWQSGYWFTEPDPDYSPSEDLARFLAEGPPPVYLGFGSMPSNDPSELATIVLGALETTGQRAVLATGWGGLSMEKLPPGLSGRVFLIDKAPHSWLFPKCAGVVHHGGAGTTHEALRWGKPSLVCPVFGDQPFWGQRVHRIGAGPAPIKQKKLTVEKLAVALKALETPSYRKGAEAARDTMTGEPGAAGAAERLMALLGA
ncbi:glycosyltransferase [uncultured Roseibium sp.]|uniref:glycosyltransferase n=1 Tax=uncultured Roseibium sp. TaxID=1936171 RepID=UPI0026073C2A|nr:glycosyltransferase [uncultured Roseibium sp.]